ncbi:MAG: hypothetical protein HUU30_18550 [Burkholderiaceae bacterium]|nr:hypothetical protein [Aquabacterium sp.]NUP87734.1 hypothetical protein [Burkholderiaceae bacterium]
MLVVALLALLGLGGCATYLDARDNVAKGGRLDQQKASAARDLESAQAQRAALQQRRAEQDAQLARMDQQLQRLQAEQKTQRAQLAQALQTRKISAAKHEQLSKELSSVKAQTEALQMKIGNARLQPGGGAVDGGDELQAVQKRHAELNKLLAQLIAG